MGNISSAFGYYKDNQNSTQKDITPFDVKLLVMNIMNKITLYKNQKTNFIKEKLQIVINNLKQNNVNLASVAMSTVLSQEDLIEVYKLLIISSAMLIEKHEVIAKNKECPKELEKHLKNLIYASQHLLTEESTNFRELIKHKYGSVFVESALENKNYCIDHQIVNGFNLKPKNDLIVISRLKELACRYNINCDFPPDELINPMNLEYIEVDNTKPYCTKNSELFENFAKDKVNKNDFIINKELDVDNGMVLVESKFDIEKLINYCNTKNIHIKNVDNQFEIVPQEFKKTEQTLLRNNNNIQNKEIFNYEYVNNKQSLNSNSNNDVYIIKPLNEINIGKDTMLTQDEQKQNNNKTTAYLISEESKNELIEYIKKREKKFREENKKNENVKEDSKSNIEETNVQEHKENTIDKIDTQIK